MRFKKFERRLKLITAFTWATGFLLFNMYEIFFQQQENSFTSIWLVKTIVINLMIISVSIFALKNQIQCKTRKFSFRFLVRKFMSLRDVPTKLDSNFIDEYYIHTKYLYSYNFRNKNSNDYEMITYFKRGFVAIVKIGIKIIAFALVITININFEVLLKSLIGVPILIVVMITPLLYSKILIKKLVIELNKSIEIFENNLLNQYVIVSSIKETTYFQRFISESQFIRREGIVSFFEISYTTIVTSLAGEKLNEFGIYRDSRTLIFGFIIPIVLLFLNFAFLIKRSRQKNKLMKLKYKFKINEVVFIYDDPREEATDAYLEHYLNYIIPDGEWKFKFQVTIGKYRRKVDAYSEIRKMIVIIEGADYFTNSKKILDQNKFQNAVENGGYQIVYIPYFIQPSTYITHILFNVEKDYLSRHRSGFQYSTNNYPADFCELGCIKFEKILKKFYFLRDEILKSIVQKIIEEKSIEMVVTNSFAKNLDNIDIDFVWREN